MIYHFDKVQMLLFSASLQRLYLLCRADRRAILIEFVRVDFLDVPTEMEDVSIHLADIEGLRYLQAIRPYLNASQSTYAAFKTRERSYGVLYKYFKMNDTADCEIEELLRREEIPDLGLSYADWLKI